MWTVLALELHCDMPLPSRKQEPSLREVPAERADGGVQLLDGYGRKVLVLQELGEREDRHDRLRPRAPRERRRVSPVRRRRDDVRALDVRALLELAVAVLPAVEL